MRNSKKAYVSFLYLVVLLISLIAIVACSDNSTKPDNTDNFSTWTKVDDFDNQPIYEIRVSQDSSNMHVVSNSIYGIHRLSDDEDYFEKWVLSQSCYHTGTHKITKSRPYMTDEGLFITSVTLAKMYTYSIADGIFQRTGCLQANDFIEENDSTYVFFAPSYNIRGTNHIVHMEDNKYCFTILRSVRPEIRDDSSPIREEVFNVIVEMDVNEPHNFNILETIKSRETFLSDRNIWSTNIINNRIMQSTTYGYLDNSGPTIIDNDYNLTFGECRYPFEDIFAYDNIHMGYGQALIYVTGDQGYTWSEFVRLNHSFNRASVAGREILFTLRNFAEIDYENLTVTNLQELPHEPLIIEIFDIAEFNGLVYVATSQGLYYRSVESFFTLKDSEESKSNNYSIDFSIQ